MSKKMIKGCKSCRFAVWQLTSSGRPQRNVCGSCDFPIPDVPLPSCIRDRDKLFHKIAIWQDDGKDCRCWQPKEDKFAVCPDCSLPQVPLATPRVDDDQAWEELAKSHQVNCKWLRTRAYRRERQVAIRLRIANACLDDASSSILLKAGWTGSDLPLVPIDDLPDWFTRTFIPLKKKVAAAGFGGNISAEPCLAAELAGRQDDAISILEVYSISEEKQNWLSHILNTLSHIPK